MKKILVLFFGLCFANSFAQAKSVFTLKDVCEEGRNKIVECLTSEEKNTFDIGKKQIVQSSGDAKTIFLVDSQKAGEKSTTYTVHVKNGEKFILEVSDKRISISSPDAPNRYTMYR